MTTTMTSNRFLNISNVEFAYPGHPEYTLFRDQWTRIRDAIQGSDAVKGKTTVYLPKLSSQRDDDYLAYRDRAVFLNTSARVLNTNVGTVIRRTPEIIASKDMKPYFATDTAGFTSFFELFRFTIRELGSVGRMGTMIDIVKNKPVPIRLVSENILNWIEDDDGYPVSILIAENKIITDPSTYISTNQVEYIRIFLEEGIYTVVREDSKKKVISKVQPSLRGRTLDYLPFVPANAFGIDINPIKPPLLDVVDVNYSHYRTSADLETGRHFVGLPQPIVSGATANNNKLYVGSPEAWVLPSKDAKAYYLEFLGQGLEGLAKALKEKEGQMAQFSAQLTDTSTRGSEAEGTVRLRYSTDAANLSDIAKSAELSLNKVYGIIADWQGYERPGILLNKDFLSDKMSYQELTALTKSWLDGGLSDDEYRFNLKRGEVLPPQQIIPPEEK